MPPPCRRMRYHRRVSEQDRWLDDKGLYRKHIVADSSCLFRIVSENVYKIQSHHHDVRSDCVEYMLENEKTFNQMVEGSYNEYVTELSKPVTYGGFIEIAVMSHMYKYDFIIYDNNKGPETYITNGHSRVILLYHVREKKHFDVLYSKEYMGDISFCQSLLYSILYKDVYKMFDVDYAVKKMLYGKDNNSIDYYMPESVLRRTSNQLSRMENTANTNNYNGMGDSNNINQTNEKGNGAKDDSEVINFTIFPVDSGDSIMIALDTSNAKEMLDNKILPFPYKVAKALDPNIYRNVELDSWYEIKKDEQPSGQYFDGLSLQVGVKCLCSLNPNSNATYHCHIQDMKGDDGPCVVFVEELGEMRTVSMNQLKPLPAEEAKPWYTPYKKERAKFYSIAGILRQLGYIGLTNNNCKFKYKLKKAGGIGQELAQLKENIDWINYKNGSRSEKIKRLDLIDYSSVDDKINNNYDKNGWENESCNTTDANETEYYECLEKYTKMDHVNFQPYKIEMVAMPLVVEQNNTPPTTDVARDTSSVNPRTTAVTYQAAQQEQALPAVPYTVQTTNGSEMSPSPGFACTTPVPGTPISLGAVVTHSGGMVWSGGNGMYNTYPLYCTPPHGAALPPPPPPPPTLMHPPLLLPRMHPLPSGVNMAAQRSMDVNGTDLPYNDISTLRYFFNLGIEYMYACRGWSLPPPMPLMPLHTTMAPGGPPPNTPSPSNYVHTPNRISPNQLAAELQQNLSLEDTTNCTQDKENPNKGNNNSTTAKGKGGMEYGNNRRGGMGGYGGRYRGGGGGNNHKNYNRNQNYYRGNNHHNTKVNNNHSNGNIKPIQHEIENNNNNIQDKDLNQQHENNPFNNNNNLSFISYPPPPLYRMPFYSIEGDGSMMPMGYTPQYLPYGTLSEDAVTSSSEAAFMNQNAAPYVGYLPTPPPMYYPPIPPNYTNYNQAHYTPTTPDVNQTK